jgi:protein-tyrosine phosphatase
LAPDIPQDMADMRHADLNAKWTRLDWAQMERLRDTAQVNGSEQPHQWARCSGEEYALRNRYANVDPYQSNRVRLEVPEGHFDYINASPIILETTKSKTQLKYIATQVRIMNRMRSFR